MQCSAWYKVDRSVDTCASVTLSSGIVLSLFGQANPSVNISNGNCTGSLINGDTYCVVLFKPRKSCELCHRTMSNAVFGGFTHMYRVSLSLCSILGPPRFSWLLKYIVNNGRCICYINQHVALFALMERHFIDVATERP
jgi:hypothetical protein